MPWNQTLGMGVGLTGRGCFGFPGWGGEGGEAHNLQHKRRLQPIFIYFTLIYTGTVLCRYGLIQYAGWGPISA